MPTGDTPPKVQLPPAKVINRGGRFDVLMRLGGGGMATVYLARSIAGGGFERLVALKVLHPHLLSEPEFLVMFLDEARVAAKIHHPNVIAIHDLGTQDAWMYMVMDYVLGDTLAAAQKVATKLRRGLPLEIVLRVALDALRGLDAAHNLVDPAGRSLNVVHRDVTPHNILLGIDGIARVTDFGIAKAEQRLTFTSLGMLKGKAPFMAPEQFRQRRVDRRADIFSMGITLWEALALRRCLPPDLTNNAERPPYRPLRDFLPNAPPALDKILLRALQTDPEDRWRTAGEFADALEANLRDHIAPHSLVGSFVGAFAQQKVEAERRAIREASARGAEEPLRGRSGFHHVPLELRGEERGEASDDGDDRLSPEELEPPTRVLPPKEAPPVVRATRSVIPLPVSREDPPRRASTPVTFPPPPPVRAETPVAQPAVAKALRGATLVGTGEPSPEACLVPSDTLQGSSALDTEHQGAAPTSDANGSGRRPSLSPLRAVAVFDPGEVGHASERPDSVLHADTLVTLDASVSDRHHSLSPLRGDTVIDPEAGARAEQAEDDDARAAQRWFDEAATPAKPSTLPPSLAPARTASPADEASTPEDRTPSDDLDRLPTSTTGARALGVALATALALVAWALWGR
jgi:serine/threonine-protein kinase